MEVLLTLLVETTDELLEEVMLADLVVVEATTEDVVEAATTEDVGIATVVVVV